MKKNPSISFNSALKAIAKVSLSTNQATAVFLKINKEMNLLKATLQSNSKE